MRERLQLPRVERRLRLRMLAVLAAVVLGAVGFVWRAGSLA